MTQIIEDYKQGAIYADSEEKAKIAEFADNNGEVFPFDCGELYRGVCGKVHEVGDVIEVSDQAIESWSENEDIAAEFSKERGTEISAVYMIKSGEVKGIPVEDYTYDEEMEWILSAAYYTVVEKEEMDTYTLYTVERN